MIYITQRKLFMALLQRFSFILLFATLFNLAGCGGSSGGFDETPDGGDGSTPDAIIVTLSIADPNLTGGSTTLTAVVTQGGQAVSNKLVAFTTTVGTFEDPTTGRKTTNNEGIAIITLNGGDVADSGTATATVESAEPVNVDFTTIGTSPITYRMGAGTPFVEGEISLSLSSISAGATSVVSILIVDEEGSLYTESVDVEFTSLCSRETTPKATLDSPIATSTGSAKSTYFAQGCAGNDPITVKAIVAGKQLTATGFINVLSANVGSIEFVSATPEHIAIQGVGSNARPESSTIVFKVVGENGNALPDRDVTFSLSSESGNITLNPSTATTNSEGLVQTVVRSGSVSRTIRVVASVDDSDPMIRTQSSELKISTGIPDQDSMSISADILNLDAWSRDGAEVTLVARLGDDNNNPPPPTTVYFTAEGGLIENLEQSCTTGDDGSCTVIWRSQNPRPEGHVLMHNTGDEYNLSSNPDVVHFPETTNTLGQKFGGRVTIVASTIGQESFPDLNGNGRFDVCEVPAFTGGVGKPCNADGSFDNSGADITYSGNDVGGNPYDLPEAFVDHNEDGLFNPSQPGGQLGGEQEEPIDYNANSIYDVKDGKYNGALCAIPEHSGCSSQKGIDIRDSAVIVMSGNTPYIRSLTPVLNINGEGTATGSVIISDLHNQPLPHDTTINFSASVGSIIAGGSTSWGNDAHNGGRQFNVAIKGETEPKSGTLFVEITDASGGSETFSVATININ